MCTAIVMTVNTMFTFIAINDRKPIIIAIG
jgi:hypothetical protein